MKKYERNQEKKNELAEVLNSFSEIGELLGKMLQGCTEYQAEVKSLKGGFASSKNKKWWFGYWRDVNYSIYQIRPHVHRCTCFKKFTFIFDLYPNLYSDNWSF